MHCVVRTYSAFLLLAGLVLGGLVAPVLHAVEHGHRGAHRHAEVQQAAQQFAAQDQPVPSDWIVTEHARPADCTLCATVLSSAVELPAASCSWVSHLFSDVFDGSLLLAVEAPFAFLIRGPPHAA